MTKNNENPGDIQEIFELKKSRRSFKKNQKSRRYLGDFQEMATLLYFLYDCMLFLDDLYGIFH